MGKNKMESKNKEIVVESGINPSFINLWVDGEPYNKANLRGPREYLTEELLEIPFHVFNNIISISIDDFKSFLKMSGDDKKKIVDKIFGFHIINQMREVLKTQTKIIKEDLDGISGAMQSQKNMLHSSLNELDLLSKKILEVSEDKLNETTDNLKKYSDLLKFHADKMSEFIKKEKDFKVELDKMYGFAYGTKKHINDLKEKLKLYDNLKCPTCASDLKTKFHEEIKNDFIASIDIATKDYNKAMENYNKAKELEKQFEIDKRNLIEKESKIRMNINSYSNELNRLKSGPKDEQLESIKSIVFKMEEQIKESNEIKTKSEEKLNWNKMVDDVLGEKGVKQLAVKLLLPSLNKEIFTLMQQMHLDYEVLFDEEFNSTISHLGQETNISTLSRGEAKKVDFVVLVAIIKLMKMKFPSINLLFLDEVLDGLDEDSVNCVIKVLKETTESLKLNIFIISHISQFPNEIFDYKIEIEKKNNFSNLSVRKL